jgi:mannobiose 2-epimerase
MASRSASSRAAYCDRSCDAAALHLAQDAFHWLDHHAHDPVYQGYFNYLSGMERPCGRAAA